MHTECGWPGSAPDCISAEMLVGYTRDGYDGIFLVADGKPAYRESHNREELEVIFADLMEALRGPPLEIDRETGLPLAKPVEGN